MKYKYDTILENLINQFWIIAFTASIVEVWKKTYFYFCMWAIQSFYSAQDTLHTELNTHFTCVLWLHEWKMVSLGKFWHKNDILYSNLNGVKTSSSSELEV